MQKRRPCFADSSSPVANIPPNDAKTTTLLRDARAFKAHRKALQIGSMGRNMSTNVKMADMQGGKRLNARILEHRIASMGQVYPKDCPIALECRTGSVDSRKFETIAQDLFGGNLVGAGNDCVACSTPPAGLHIVFIGSPVKAIRFELFVIFIVVAISWINAAVQILA